VNVTHDLTHDRDENFADRYQFYSLEGLASPLEYWKMRGADIFGQQARNKSGVRSVPRIMFPPKCPSKLVRQPFSIGSVIVKETIPNVP
jgi:hypothetical protein